MWTFEDELELVKQILETIHPNEETIVTYDLDCYRNGIVKRFEFAVSSDHSDFFLEKYFFRNYFMFYKDNRKGLIFMYVSKTAQFEFNRSKNTMIDWIDLLNNGPKRTMKEEMQLLAFELNNPPKLLPDC